MRKNVTGRTVVIVVTILVCVFGIIGFPKSGAALMENLRHNIRLGLDLKGGSHLVLQVHVQDAIKTEADGAIERMKENMRKQGIDYTSIDRNDPATVEDADKIEIDVKGVPEKKTTAFRSMIAELFSQWTLTHFPALKTTCSTAAPSLRWSTSTRPRPSGSPISPTCTYTGKPSAGPSISTRKRNRTC